MLAKRAVGRLGDMIGEEVMLTVEDFREKGAVGAVKDAVADAGDILIDGVSGIIGWVRGDPPLEDESVAAEDATKGSPTVLAVRPMASRRRPRLAASTLSGSCQRTLTHRL